MKIVFLVSRIPYPLEKGDKLRAYYQLKHLCKSNDVHLLCLNDSKLNTDAVKHLETICSSVNVYKLSKIKIIWRLFLALFSRKPYQVNYFYDLSIAKKISQKINALNPDHIYCQLIRTTEYVKNFHQYPKTLDYMDTFSKGMLRRAEHEGWLIRQFVMAEANRLTTYENIIFDYFDNHTIISEQDRDLIYHKDRKSIHIIPNGISQELLLNTKEFDKKYDLLFHGNLSYFPNVDCVRYIVQELMPLLIQKKTDIKIAVSGASPSSKVIEYCKKYPQNIFMLGFVDDIVATYRSTHVFIAPLQTGTGLQNKILEAMALKIPCVASELCNNALKATNKVHLYTARNPTAYIISIIELLNDEDLRKRIAQQGYDYVSTHFSWEKGGDELVNIFKNSTFNRD